MTAPAAAPAPPARRRGRENVRDMLLSMAVCTAVIVPVWYLAQPPDSDSKAVRVVDPSADTAAFVRAAPGVPVPAGLPAGWRATSSTLEGTRYRIGYLTPDGGYAEYAAQAGAPGTFVEDQTGRGTPAGSLSVGSRQARVWSDGTHTSLVLDVEGGTVVVGGLREAADDDELTELAAALR